MGNIILKWLNKYAIRNSIIILVLFWRGLTPIPSSPSSIFGNLSLHVPSTTTVLLWSCLSPNMRCSPHLSLCSYSSKKLTEKELKYYWEEEDCILVLIKLKTEGRGSIGIWLSLQKSIAFPDISIVVDQLEAIEK